MSLRDLSGLPTFVDLVHHANRAYTKAPTIADKATGCEVRIEYLGADLAVVAFRGTKGFQDAWMDARVMPWYDPEPEIPKWMM